MKATESEWVEASEDEDEEDDEDDSENDDNSEGSNGSDEDDSDEEDFEVKASYICYLLDYSDNEFLVAKQNSPCFSHLIKYPFIIMLIPLLCFYFLLHLQWTLFWQKSMYMLWR